MVKTKFNFEFGGDETKIAKAFAANQSISPKYSNEICRELMGKSIQEAETFLNKVILHETHLPLRKYTKKVAHRAGDPISGTKSGRYPWKACEAFLTLLKSVKANADYKGLDSENLKIIHAFASYGFRRQSHQVGGKIGGKMRKRKSTHIEVIVKEFAA